MERGLSARRREDLFVYYRIVDLTFQQICRLVSTSLAQRHDAVRAGLTS